MQIEYLGNKDLLNQHKTAFLCSRIVSSGAVLRCYDWATNIDLSSTVIISGFQSKIEKDILHLLLKRNAKIIIVLGRQMYKAIPEELVQSYHANQLLFISISKQIRTTKESAKRRNNYISELADSLVWGYISTESSLNSLHSEYLHKSIKL